MHVGSAEECDVGPKLGCVGLVGASAASDSPELGTTRLTIGATVARPVVAGVLGTYRTYTSRNKPHHRTGMAFDITMSGMPISLLAHAETAPWLEGRRVRGASATRETFYVVADAPAPEEEFSGFPDLDALRETVGPFETHIGGSFRKASKQRVLRDLVTAARSAPSGGRAHRPLYCETGFNAGYSASAALSSGADVVAFDFGELGSVYVAADALRRSFAAQTLELHSGDSCTALENATVASALLSAGRRCDVVFVDGGHDLGPADCDIRLLSRLAAPGARVVVDDVVDSCVTEKPPGLCDGPALAWRGALQDELVVQEFCHEDGFCVGTYVDVDTALHPDGAYRQ